MIVVPAVLVVLMAVEPAVFVALPAPVAHVFEVAAGFTRLVAVAAPTVDSVIEVPFGALDTITAAAPFPRLGLSQRGSH